MNKNRLRIIRDTILDTPDRFHMDTFDGKSHCAGGGDSAGKPGFCGSTHCIAGLTVKTFRPADYEVVLKSESPELNFRNLAAELLEIHPEEADELFYPYAIGSPSGNGWSPLARRLYYENQGNPEQQAQIAAEVIDDFINEREIDHYDRDQDDVEEDLYGEKESRNLDQREIEEQRKDRD